jgi:Transposase IS116/IS110/IS902 family
MWVPLWLGRGRCRTTGVPGQLHGRGEPGDVADLGGDREAGDPADARRGHQQWDVAMIGAGPAQPGLEIVDQLKARPNVTHPGLGEIQLGEKPAAGDAEQISHRDLMAEAISDAWTRVLRIARCLTRCSRHRARSRSARSSGDDNQIAGTRSLNDSFANRRASTGLCPHVSQSGDVDRRGPLVKHGPRYLRWGLMEAAIAACSHPPFEQRYQRTKRRLGRQRGAKVAQIELARKLSEAIWYMLSRNQPFKPFAPAGAISRLTA